MNSEDPTTISATVASETVPSLNISSNFETILDGEESLETFKKLCQLLDISEQLVYLSIKDYNAVKSCFILQGDQKLWLICALYGLVLSISNSGTLAAILCKNSNANLANNCTPMSEIPLSNRKANIANYTTSGCIINTPNLIGSVGSKINYPTTTTTTTTTTTSNSSSTTATNIDSAINNNNDTLTSSLSTISLQLLSDNSDSNALLSKLLRLVKINVNFFFSKFNNWMRMIDLPRHVTQLISTIEVSEGVTCVLFQKYVQLFGLFFRTPEEYTLIDLKSNKRKTRKRSCDPNELFHFCWMLFIATKELISVINDVSSGFHLLLHSIRFAFINVIHENEHVLPSTSSSTTSTFSANIIKLLAPSFIENDEKYTKLKNSSIDELDRVFYDALIVNKIHFVPDEAEASYHNIFIPALEFIKHQNQFSFNFSTFTSALEPDHITSNLKYLIEFYRDYRIIYFGIDEMEYVKVLYANDVFVPLVINQSNAILPFSSADFIKNDSSIDPLKVSTNKKSIAFSANNQDELSLSLSPEHYVMNLMNLLKRTIYNSDGSNYKSLLEDLLKSNNFHTALRKATSLPDSALEVFQRAVNDENADTQHNDDTWNICVDLYYKMLYTTVHNEISKSPNSEDLTNIMSFISSHEFHKSLLTICFDIFIFVTNLQKPFPWICTLFDIEPFYLTQCIELIIKYEPKLPRAVAKHLTILEEDIVSCYGWAPTSPIYARLDAQVHGGTTQNEASKYTEERLSCVLPYFCNVKIDGVLDYDETLVNTSESLFDAANHVIGGYHDQLSNKYCPIEVCYYMRPSSNKMISSTVSIFYQKVYHIILTRLNDFAIKLNLSKGEKSLIWKCVEYMLVFHTYLMKDHHLDQLLICSIYTVMKVINRSVSFGRILHYYESQPQAKLSLSRNVSSSIINTLLHNNSLSISFNVSLEKNTLQAYISPPIIRSSNLPPTVVSSANTTTTAAAAANAVGNKKNTTGASAVDSSINIKCDVPIGGSITYVVNDETKSRLLEFFTTKQLVAMNDETCDIIQFYNKIFSHIVQRFANEMAQFFIQKKIFVEPYPVLKTDSLVSPTRISQNYSVFVSPMKMTNPSNNHYNPDQPPTPFFNNKFRQHHLATNSVRFNLASDKSPLVCREINRFVAESKRDFDYASFPTPANPVRRRLLIDEDDTRKMSKFDRTSVPDTIK